MNGDLVHEESAHLAKPHRSGRRTKIAAAQIDRAFERILSREPSAQERAQFPESMAARWTASAACF